MTEYDQDVILKVTANVVWFSWGKSNVKILKYYIHGD